jgi:RNA polymerase sigma-70 factor (ECF subfamily)
MPAIETSEQVVRSRNGDPEAFAMLVAEHQRMIHALCFRMTGSMADAEDLAQETFIQAYRHLAGFRGEAGFGSWLYRIAVNHCLNWKKRHARQQELLNEWGRQELTESTSEEPARHPVQEALMKLPAKQRAAVILTTYDGLSHAEAAEALGCSETTVSWRLFAARRKLRRLLKNLQPVGGSL